MTGKRPAAKVRALIGLFLLLGGAPAPAVPPAPLADDRPPLALILRAPGLRLADLRDSRLPNLKLLVDGGAVALVNGLTPTGQAELRRALAALPGVSVTTTAGRFLTRAPERPYGVAADLAALSRAARAGLERHGRVQVEPGDLERAERYAPLCFPELAARHRAAALADLDRLVNKLRAATKARGGELHLLVPAAATPGPLGMGLWIASGPGWRPGRIASAATRGEGVVARADVIAALARAQDAPSAPGLRVVPGGVDDLERLAAAGERTERLRGPAWAALRGGLLLLALLALPAGRPRLARSLLPAVLAFFLALLLTGHFVAPAGSGRMAWHLGLMLMAGAAISLRRKAVLPLLAATTLLLLGEIVSGGHLLQWSPLGYSIALGARSYGIGNEAMGVLLGAVLLLPFAVSAAWPGHCSGGTLTICGALLWGVAALLAGSPAWGANFGGALAMLLTASLALPALAGRRLRPRHAACAIAALLLLGMGLALWDASRPVEAQSHLGRLMAAVRSEGLAPLAALLASKASTALRVAGSLWTLLLLVEAVVGLILLRRIGPSPPPGTLDLRAGLPLLLPATLALLLFNDSGVVAAALCLALLPAGACRGGLT